MRPSCGLCAGLLLVSLGADRTARVIPLALAGTRHLGLDTGTELEGNPRAPGIARDRRDPNRDIRGVGRPPKLRSQTTRTHPHRQIEGASNQTYVESARYVRDGSPDPGIHMTAPSGRYETIGRAA